MEVLNATSGFRPIQYTEKETRTPGDSPTAGILPVGGVVKGHSLPGAKNVPLARVRLERDLTGSEKPSESLKAFVAIAPKREKALVVIGSNSEGAEGGSLLSTNENRPAAKEPSQEKMEGQESGPVDVKNMGGEKDPSGVKIDGTEGHCGGKVDDAKEPSGGKMDSAKKPYRDQMDGPKEPSGENMDFAKEPSGGKMDDKASSAENLREREELPGRCSERENELSVGGIRSSWYIVEQTSEDEGTAEEYHSANEGEQNLSQEQLFTAVETKGEGGGTEKTSAGLTFTRGHRRVASSPPAITVLSEEGKAFPGGKFTTAVSHLERSRSDSDISSHVKQDLNDSLVSQHSF